jgi:DMSO/TMAO reductase YedYZ molybdopterin-dependent catalytic subunit
MQSILFSRKQRFQLGFLAGLMAGVVASLLMVLFSLLLGTVSLPELLGSAVTQFMPPALFQALHEFFGPDAKRYLFYIILVGQCFVFALGGGLCNLLLSLSDYASLTDKQGRLRWSVGPWLAGVLWLLTGVLFLPLTGAGIFGVSLPGGIVSTMVSLAIVGLLFGLLFVFAQNWLMVRRLQALGAVDAEEAAEAGLSRRTLLTRGGFWIGAAAVGVLAWRFISNGVNGGGQTLSGSSADQLQKSYQPKIEPTSPAYSSGGNFSQIAGLSPEITSNDQFYQVSKNLSSDPVVNANGWSMTIYGQVDQPYTLNYAQLQALPTKQQYETLMCISNEVGGQYMSNALWEGVPLSDLLAKAGKIKPGSSKVVLYAQDDYSDSIHLSKALEPTTLVALRMNGVPLPSEHGYPARLLVPGIYGMKHVKWITKIEVVNTDYQGYWQNRGWSDPAPIRMTSRIDTPNGVQTVKAGVPTYIAGVAFSGNKGISEVDVSMDSGTTWQHAVLKKPLSDLSWVLWEVPWKPKAGTYTLVVRAIDSEGNVQDPTPASPAPDGSSGYDGITVTVS